MQHLVRLLLKERVPIKIGNDDSCLIFFSIVSQAEMGIIMHASMVSGKISTS